MGVAIKRLDSVSLLFPKESEIPAEVQLSGPVEQTEYLVDGELRCWSGPFKKVYSPVCVRTPQGLEPKYIGSYPLLTEKEALASLDAAIKAWDSGRGRWPTMSVSERIRCIENFTFRMSDRKDEVVKLLMWEIGKSYSDSEKEFDRTVAYIRDTIDALKNLDRSSSRFVIEQGIIGQIRRAPLGVVLCMGPFNYPLNETFTTLIPALIMGNIVIFKPPKKGVLLHRPLLEAFRDSFPPGVVNTVYGKGEQVVAPMMSTGSIDCLAFIGSSHVAGELKKQHPRPYRLRSVLGLEAKNPGIVLADADLDSTIKECLTGCLSYNGQRCTALKILFVDSKIAEEFTARFTREVEKLKCGMPWEKGVTITPLPDLRRTDYMTQLVEDACSNGARILNLDGGRCERTMFTPAILYPVKPNMKIYREEQFGPIVPIVPYDTIDTPIRYVVESNYGQQASIFGKSPALIAELVDPLVNQVCRLNINSQCQRGPDTFPFSGRKDSAEGTLSVSDALRVFSIRTLVATKDNEANKEILGTIIRERRSNFLSTDFIL